MKFETWEIHLLSMSNFISFLFSWKLKKVWELNLQNRPGFARILYAYKNTGILKNWHNLWIGKIKFAKLAIFCFSNWNVFSSKMNAEKGLHEFVDAIVHIIRLNECNWKKLLLRVATGKRVLFFKRCVFLSLSRFKWQHLKMFKIEGYMKHEWR